MFEQHQRRVAYVTEKGPICKRDPRYRTEDRSTSVEEELLLPRIFCRLCYPPALPTRTDSFKSLTARQLPTGLQDKVERYSQYFRPAPNLIIPFEP